MADPLPLWIRRSGSEGHAWSAGYESEDGRQWHGSDEGTGQWMRRPHFSLPMNSKLRLLLRRLQKELEEGWWWLWRRRDARRRRRCRG